MILYFDNYITDTPLYPSSQTPNDEVRNACVNYQMPSKIDIAKYSLASYATIPWSHVLIKYKIDDEKAIQPLDDYIYGLFPKATIIHHRSDTQEGFKESLAIMDKFEDDWIFLAPNVDHPLIAPKINILDMALAKAKELKNHHKYVSVIYSHFSEFINYPKHGNPFHDAFGKDTRIIDENTDTISIIKEGGDYSGIQMVHKDLFRHWFTSIDLTGIRIIRPESLSEKVITTNQVLVMPKKEICAHFDGYAHTIGSKHEILPDQVPPLFIPQGFFENKIRIAYGYDNYREGWTNINPSAKQYSFRDNLKGTDIMCTLEDMPLFWNGHIDQIDSNPLRNDAYLKKMRDKKYRTISNPWRGYWKNYLLKGYWKPDLKKWVKSKLHN